MIDEQSCDLDSDTPTGLLRGRLRTPTIGIVLIVTLLAFESMAVGTVMPVVARELDGLALYPWSFSAFMVASLLAMVAAGVASDRSGPAPVLFLALGTFMGGLLVAGLATRMPVFVLGRAVQGLGAGGAVVALYVVIGRTYPEELRRKVFAALAAAWVVPSIIGPALAGFVAEHLDWRWVFLGLIPLVMPSSAMLIPVVRSGRGAGERTGEGAGAASRKEVAGRLVAAGAVAAGTAAVLYAADHVSWRLFPIAVLGLCGLLGGLPRLLPAGALRLRCGLPTVVTMRGLLTGAFFATEAFIPLGLTSLHGFAPSTAGAVLTVGALGWSAASWYQSRSDHSNVALVRAGAVLVLVGVTAMTMMSAISVVSPVQVSGWFAVPAWLVAGAGMGLGLSNLSVLTLNLSPPAEHGTNSAALQISDAVGSSLGVGLAGVLAVGFGADRLNLGLTVAGLVTVMIGLSAVGASTRLRHPTEGRDDPVAAQTAG